MKWHEMESKDMTWNEMNEGGRKEGIERELVLTKWHETTHEMESKDTTWNEMNEGREEGRNWKGISLN